MNNIMGYAFLYFVLKYFIYRLLDIPPLDGLSYDDLSAAGINLLLFYGFMIVAFYSSRSLVECLARGRRALVPRGSMYLPGYLLPASLVAITVALGGVGVLTSPLETRAILDNQGMMYLTLSTQFIITFYSFELLERRRYVALCVYSCWVLPFAFVSGASGTLVSYILNLLYFLNARRRVGIALYCMLAVVLAVPWVVIGGIYRDAAKTSIRMEQLGQLLESRLQQDALLTLVTQFVYRIDQLEGLTLLSKAEANDEIQHSYGAEMTEIVVAWVPRFLWPEKPKTFTMQMTQHFRPAVIEAGGGNNFTGIGELLFNFGPPGVAVGGFAFGFIMCWACEMWEQCPRSFGMTVVNFAVIQPYLFGATLAAFVNDLPFEQLLLSGVLMVMVFRIRVLPVRQALLSVARPQSG